MQIPTTLIGHETLFKGVMSYLDTGGGALIVAGPSHVGRKTTIRYGVMAFFCEGAGKPCHRCRSCEALRRGTYPDYFEVYPDEEGSTLGIKNISRLRELAFSAPSLQKVKVLVVWPAEALTREASNALLKVLEEPPKTTKILLVVNNIYSVLPTIRSRCQTLVAFPLPMSRVDLGLTQVAGLTVERRSEIVNFVRGRIGQAFIYAFDEAQFIEDIDIFRMCFDVMKNRDIILMKKIMELEKDFQVMEYFLKILESQLLLPDQAPTDASREVKLYRLFTKTVECLERVSFRSTQSAHLLQTLMMHIAL